MQITVTDNFIGVKAIEAKIQAGIAMGLAQSGEEIKQAAIPKTPKLTGALRESAEVNLKGGNKAASVEVSFNTDYAYKQEYGDKFGYRRYTTPGTGPYYLTTAFETNKMMSLTIIAQSIRRSLSF